MSESRWVHGWHDHPADEPHTDQCREAHEESRDEPDFAGAEHDWMVEQATRWHRVMQTWIEAGFTRDEAIQMVRTQMQEQLRYRYTFDAMRAAHGE